MSHIWVQNHLGGCSLAKSERCHHQLLQAQDKIGELLRFGARLCYKVHSYRGRSRLEHAEVGGAL